MKTKPFVSMAALGVLSLSGAASASWAQPAAVTVWNESGSTIEQVYISDTSDLGWGWDLLGGSDGLASGYHTTFFEYPGTYDVKLVAVTGDTCIVNEVWVWSDRGLIATPDMWQCKVV